jgi:hypothetical protein
MRENKGNSSMPVNIPRLVYFESFMNSIAVSMLSGRDDLDLVRWNTPPPLMKT